MNYTDLTAYRKSNPFMDFCGIEAVRAEHDDCEVKMTITATDKNTHGFVHGGLLFTLADCVAAMTAAAIFLKDIMFQSLSRLLSAYDVDRGIIHLLRGKCKYIFAFSWLLFAFARIYA